MKKIETVNKEEQVLVESKTFRDKYVEKFDVLDKIKVIPYLTDDLVVSISQVAEFYEVTTKAISTVIDRNRSELEDDGVVVLKGEELRKFKKNLTLLRNEVELIDKRTPSLTLLTKRAMLRIGMLLTTSDVAKKVRSYLLNLDEIATKEQKEWAIQREVGKVDRKRMCTAIVNYLPESKNKIFAFPNYTNMIYRILFGKTAKELRQEKGIATNELLRDSFSKEELKMVDEFETIVTALLSLGFNYDYIQTQLKKKHTITKN
jgi:hypothetical protein